MNTKGTMVTMNVTLEVRTSRDPQLSKQELVRFIKQRQEYMCLRITRMIQQIIEDRHGEGAVASAGCSFEVEE